MSSVSQILDNIAAQNPNNAKKKQDFKAEWSTVHIAVFKKDGTTIESQPGNALDEFEGEVLCEVRRSNHFPVPRYQVFVGVRSHGRNTPSISPRTRYDDEGQVVCDTTTISIAQEAYNYAGIWVKDDVLKVTAQPRAQKVIQQRVRGGNDQGNSTNGQRQTGKTARDRAKKQRPAA